MGNPTFKIRYTYIGHRSKGKNVIPQKPITEKTGTDETVNTSFPPEDSLMSSAENVPQTEELADYDMYSSKPLYDYIVYLWLPVSLIIASYIIVALMAQHRKRNAISWVLLSIIITPFIAIILLFLKGSKAKINYYYRETNARN